MVWEPFALAILFGLITSAVLHFVIVWPRREPPDGDETDDAEGES